MAGTGAGHAGATATDVKKWWYLGGRTQVGRWAQARGEGGFAESAYRTQDHGSPQGDRTQEHGTQDRSQEHGTQDDRATRSQGHSSQVGGPAQDDRTQEHRSEVDRAEDDPEDDPEKAPLAS